MILLINYQTNFNYNSNCLNIFYINIDISKQFYIITNKMNLLYLFFIKQYLNLNLRININNIYRQFLKTN